MGDAASGVPTDARPDLAGILISAGCAAHCVAVPILLTIAPVAGALLSARWVHLSLLGLLIPVAAVAFWRGYRDHGHARAVWCGGAGLWILACVAAMERPNTCCTVDASTYRFVLLSVLGSVTLAAGHLMNLRDGLNGRRSRMHAKPATDGGEGASRV